MSVFIEKEGREGRVVVTNGEPEPSTSTTYVVTPRKQVFTVRSSEDTPVWTSEEKRVIVRKG